MSADKERRGLAVTKAIREMQDVLNERDKHERLGELLKKLSPEDYVEIRDKGDVPIWYMNLVLTLTRLYDQGYTDSTKDSEQLK